MQNIAQTQARDTQLYRDVFNASPIGIAVENLEGEPLFVNPAFCSFLGFSEEELRNKHCVDFSPQEDAEKDWALFQKLRAGSINHYQLEKRYFRQDGSLVWGHLSISLLNSHPSPLVLAMVEDITEKKKAQEVRFRHAAIVESSEDAILSKDLNARITSWNSGAEAMFGYREAEALDQSITLITPPDLWDEENTILQRLRSGERIEHYETTRVSKSGKAISVSLTISPIKDSTGTLVGFSSITRDITERKRAETLQRETNRALEAQAAALRSQEELLKIFVKTVPAGVAMLDRDMRYLQVSDRWGADYGVDSSQILGHSHYEIYSDIPQRWKEIHRRALDGETLRAEEDRWDRQDGLVRWVRWEIRPWKTSGGDIGGILILAEDITHRKQMEEVLSGMTRKLVESQEQERARIGRELHDDINQRLALLAVDLEQLAENPSEVRNRAQTLRKEIIGLSNDVQALSHELHASNLEYLGIVAGLESWSREFGQRQKMEIDFKSDVPGVLPFEVGLCLLRVLQEALHNASKHSGVKRAAVQIEEHSNEVHLIVRDSGKGFDVEAGKHGSGLGLTSMRERVRLVNGTITIESEPMSGTTIHVRVPLRPENVSGRADG